MDRLPVAALCLVAAFSVDDSLRAAAHASRGLCERLSAPAVAQWRSVPCQNCSALYRPRDNSARACAFHPGQIRDYFASSEFPLKEWGCCGVNTDTWTLGPVFDEKTILDAPGCVHQPHGAA